MAVFIKKVNIPQKSDLINIDMTGSGTAQTYRVLKNVSGSVVEVMSMSDDTTSMFSGSNNTYEGSTLDTYLNTTWYSTLSNDAKSAIVDKTFRQDKWYLTAQGDPDYNGFYGTTKPGTNGYTVSLMSASFGNEITRHVYAISTQDVLDYVLDTTITDGELQNYNIWKMFWNNEVQHTNMFVWLMSASTSGYAMMIQGTSGYISDRNYSISSNMYARPAFQIDLSKIDFTYVDSKPLYALKPVSVLQKSSGSLSRVNLSYKTELPVVTDLAGTTWVFNDNVTISSAVSATTFTINGTITSDNYTLNCNSLEFLYDSTNQRYFLQFYATSVRAFPCFQWAESLGWQYRETSSTRYNISAPTISIVSGHTSQPDLVAWFYANATRIS